MNDETIFDPKEVKEGNEPLVNDETVLDGQQDDTTRDASQGQNKRGYKTAGIAGAAGLAGAAIGVLTPVNVFPDAPVDNGDISDEGLSPEPAPSSTGHLQGHDMDVATGVNDSMSFSQAFAAARQEVGPGGLFVWHGNTYGTYYRNEWDAMTAEDRDQYWADVYHTTSHVQYEPSPEPEPAPQPIPEPDPDPKPEPEPDPKPEPEPDPDPTPHPETLNINENDIHEVLDLDGDGQIDAVVVDANGNEIPDAIFNTTGDGNFDTLILDVEEDQTGDIVEIAGVNVVSNAEPTPVDPVDNNVLVINENDVYEAADMRGDGNVDTLIVDADGNENLDLVLDTTGDGNLDTLILDPGVDDDGNLIVDENNVVGIDGVVITPDEGLVNPDDENMAENQDIDDSALAMNDPNITIENNMDMDDFIA